MKNLILVIAVILISVSTYAQTSWKVDPYHSKVNFSVSHLVISEVDGTFKAFDGSLTTYNDNFSNAQINFEIDINSINTDNEKRDGHLKSEDFFYAEKYPKMTFVGTSFQQVNGNKYLLKGNLTMRGVTKSIELDVKYGGTIDNDGYGNTKAGFIITGSINRIPYGVAWNAKTEHGGWTVGEDVNITVKLEFVKQK